MATPEAQTPEAQTLEAQTPEAQKPETVVLSEKKETKELPTGVDEVKNKLKKWVETNEDGDILFHVGHS